MAIKFTTTAKAKTNGVKLLVYGKAGAGKTYMCSTAPKPLIISCESGLLSLSGFKLPVIDGVRSLEDLEEALDWVQKKAKAKGIKTICLDSISEMGEVVLADRKQHNKDARKAYGELGEAMDRIIKAFRDLEGFHVYFSAKEKKLTDEENGVTSFVPSMPGTTLTSNLPYMFDGVFYLRKENVEGKLRRYLLTEADYHYEVKDRSSKLNPKEPANLTKIFEKIERS